MFGIFDVEIEKKKQNKINCQSTNCLVFHTHPLAKTYYFIEKIEFNLFYLRIKVSELRLTCNFMRCVEKPDNYNSKKL